MGRHPRSIQNPIRITVQGIHMWGAAIVEVFLKWFLDLWEAQNNDVHGHTKSEQTTRLKALHQITACRMMAQKPLVQPTRWMLPDNPDTFLETATANRLGTWIASHRKTNKNSAKRAKKESSRGTSNIRSFFPHPLIQTVWPR